MIDTSSFEALKKYYDFNLNLDKSTYFSSNDEPTPIDCISEMIEKIPEELWKREKLKILDPCCGNGNFFLPIFHKLLKYNKIKNEILEDILYFNDISKKRLDNVKEIYNKEKYNLNITEEDYLLTYNEEAISYDLIVANPPFAKIMKDGKRASKNHNLIKDFIEKSLSILKPSGYLLFITPNNWMSYADRNKLITKLTSNQIIHLDIGNAKKYFKKIGSSFTWYIIQKCSFYKEISITGLWKNKEYESNVISSIRNYIPLFYTKEIQSILSKTIDNKNLEKFKIETNSYLHKYTKKVFINDTKTDIFKYKLIHTPKQTVYSSKPHKFQEGYKVFISTTDKYKVFLDNCGMTQSICYILCSNKSEAEKNVELLQHPLYVFINNICRWGNFNNIRILQSFPIPKCNYENIYNYFHITKEEIKFIEENI